MMPIAVLRRIANQTAADPSLGYLSPLNATTLYSMRLRNASYVGKCCRVKNLTTTTETDIPFDASGWCSMSALLATWSSSQTIRVCKWYDQISTVDAVQTSDSRMPLIVSLGGDIQLMNGHPAGKWDDGSRRMEVASNAAFGFGTSTAFTLDTRVNSTGISSAHYNSVLDHRAGTGAGFGVPGVSGTFKETYFNGGNVGDTGTSVTDNVTHALVWSYDGTNLEQFLDGVRQSTSAQTVVGGSSRPLLIGNSQEDGGAVFAGYFGEVLINKGTGNFTGSSYTPRSYA